MLKDTTITDVAAVAPSDRRTREAWLQDAVDAFRPWVNLYADAELPEVVQVSVGIPKGGPSVIGQCWYDSEDGRPIIYISPALTDTARVLDVLLHELIHASLGPGHGHGKAFKDRAVAMGLTGRMTATVAGDLLSFACTALARELGEYDHATHKPMRRTTGRRETPKGGGVIPGADVPKKQTGSRYKKLVASDCCGYLVRTTRKWLEEYGAPLCPHGSVMQREE